MASPEVININALAQPVTDESIAGIDIRSDSSPSSPYYTIKDARNAARAAERNSMFDENNSEADEYWRKIINIAPDILNDHSKDIEIACWYTEALLRRYGFQGLRDGFSLIKQLIDLYWDNIFPLPDEDGIETRVSPLTGLNGEGAEGVLLPPIRNVLITEGSSVGPFSYWQYQQALDIQKISDEESRAQKINNSGFCLDDIEQAVSESNNEFYVDLRDDISECIHLFKAISDTLDQHCGTIDAPPTSNIIHLLEDYLGAVNHLAKYKFPTEESNDNVDTEDAEIFLNSQISTHSGPIKSRDDAIKQIILISDFFRKTEPHSPISYVLEKAVKWGEMPLNELIKELIPDNSSRDFYGSLTGVRIEDEY